jgi:hypothetical protein
MVQQEREEEDKEKSYKETWRIGQSINSLQEEFTRGYDDSPLRNGEITVHSILWVTIINYSLDFRSLLCRDAMARCEKFE